MYGPVRTVVWQGSADDRRPYADQVGNPENENLAHTFPIIASGRLWTLVVRSKVRAEDQAWCGLFESCLRNVSVMKIEPQ